MNFWVFYVTPLAFDEVVRGGVNTSWRVGGSSGFVRYGERLADMVASARGRLYIRQRGRVAKKPWLFT